MVEDISSILEELEELEELAEYFKNGIINNVNHINPPRIKVFCMWCLPGNTFLDKAKTIPNNEPIASPKIPPARTIPPFCQYLYALYSALNCGVSFSSPASKRDLFSNSIAASRKGSVVVKLINPRIIPSENPETRTMPIKRSDFIFYS